MSARGTVSIYLVQRHPAIQPQHERIYPESGDIVSWDEGGVIVTQANGGRRIYPWHNIDSIYEDPPSAEPPKSQASSIGTQRDWA